jgi:large subunit ribosomal protein L1
LDQKILYPLKSAVEVLAKFPKAKFNETVEVAFRLGVDPKQSDQMVRGTVPLPHGSGKVVKVLVFAKSAAAADAARNAGAEFVGYEDLIQKCVAGWSDFDVAIATPEAMSEVRKLGKVLGPRGLMPNPKTGTVTDDTAKAVREVKAGRVEFKLDKAGNVHVPVGKASFTPQQLAENARVVIEAVAKARPASVKGVYLQSCTLSATMSPPVRVDLREFLAAA